MTNRTKVVFGGVVAVLAFDAVASVSSRVLTFPYEWATLGSIAIDLTIGFIAGRTAGANPIRFAVFAAAMAGFADVSFGWGISWALGAGAVAPGTLTVVSWLATAVFVMSTAALFGGIGGLVGYRSRPVSPPAA